PLHGEDRAPLLEATEQGERLSPCGRYRFLSALLLGVYPGEGVAGGGPACEASFGARPQELVGKPCQRGVAYGALERGEDRVHARAHVRDLGEGVVGDEQRHVVPGGFEQWEGFLDRRLEPLRGAFGIELDLQPSLPDAAAKLRNLVRLGGATLGQLGCAAQRFVAVPRMEQRVAELDLQREVDLARGCEGRGAPEEADSCLVVGAQHCAPSSARQPGMSRRSQIGSIGESEFVAVAAGLFQMVPEYLVELGELLGTLLEPLGEPLVELGPDRLRKPVVGGIPDQEMAEAEGVVAG